MFLIKTVSYERGTHVGTYGEGVSHERCSPVEVAHTCRAVRATVGSYGGGVSHERCSPVEVAHTWRRVSGFESRVPGFGFRVLGFGFRVSGCGFGRERPHLGPADLIPVQHAILRRGEKQIAGPDRGDRQIRKRLHSNFGLLVFRVEV